MVIIARPPTDQVAIVLQLGQVSQLWRSCRPESKVASLANAAEPYVHGLQIDSPGHGSSLASTVVQDQNTARHRLALDLMEGHSEPSIAGMCPPLDRDFPRPGTDLFGHCRREARDEFPLAGSQHNTRRLLDFHDLAGGESAQL